MQRMKTDPCHCGLRFRLEAKASRWAVLPTRWILFLTILLCGGMGSGATEWVPTLDEFRCETCDRVPDGFSSLEFRHGDFSSLFASSETRVIDPVTDRPFPNNVIPQARRWPNGAWPGDIYERNVREGTFNGPGGREAQLVAEGWTMLHEAVANGSSSHPRGWLNPALLDESWDWGDLQAGLQNGSRRGWTPLHLAAQRAHPGVVERLLELGVYPDARAFDGATPLLVAGSLEVFEALRAAGADIRARRDDGTTVLHRAAWRTDAATVRSLIAAGLDPNAARDSGSTPLMSAGSVEVFEALRAGGADIRARTNSGGTVLHQAAWRTDAATVRSLIAAGLDPNAETADGWTVLHSAAAGTDAATVRFLVAAGLDPNAATDTGLTPLHFASPCLTVPASSRPVCPCRSTPEGPKT